jgi:hypothetical protein
LNSNASEGLQNAVEVCRDADDRPILLKGYRRITATRLLPAEGVADFKKDMPIKAIEVIGGTHQDRAPADE